MIKKLNISQLSEIEKIELVWEYAISIGLNKDVVFNYVDGGCEIFMEMDEKVQIMNKIGYRNQINYYTPFDINKIMCYYN